MKNIFLRKFLTGSMLLLFSAALSAAEPVEYAGKVSGDNALSLQNFDAAAGFYRTYRQEAENLQDIPAVRDALESEINARILGARAAQAEELLSLYRQRFPDAEKCSVSLWSADILLLKRDPANAAVILTQLLPEIPKQDPRRIRAMLSLAAAHEMLKAYDAAVGIYSELLKNSPDTLFFRKLEERRILALTALGKTDEAIELLAKLKLNEDARSIEAYRLLNTYLSLKNHAKTESFANEKTEEEAKEDGFFFLITSLIGDEFFRIGDYASALGSYRMAYLYARTSEEAFSALTAMAVMLEKMDKPQDAASLALKHLDLFKRAGTPLEIKMGTIRLLAKTKHEKEALDMAKLCLAEQSDKNKPQIFRNLFHMLLENHIPDTAGKLAIHYCGGKNDAPETLNLLAEVEEARGDLKKAADLYTRVTQIRQDDLRARKKAVTLYAKLKDHESILKLTGSKGNKTDAALMLYRAESFETLGRKEEAKKEYLNCAGMQQATTAQKAQALFRAATLYYKDKDFATAAKHFEAVFRSDSPLAPSAGYWLTLCAYCSADDNLPEKHTLALVKRFPGSREAGYAMLNLADFYINYGQAGKAEDLLNRMTSNAAGAAVIRAQAMFRKAQISCRNKDYSGAEKILKDLIKNHPVMNDSADVHFLHGDVLRKQNRFEEAAESYQRSAGKQPGTSLAQAAAGSEGDCYFAIAAKNDDIKGYRKALDLYMSLLSQKDLLPEFYAMTAYKAGRCHQLLGETRPAVEQFRKLLSFLPADRLSARPAERFWIIKGMNAFEVIAMKSTDAGIINDAIRVMTALHNAGVAPDQNYRKRINTLKRLKRQTITTGETIK